MIAAHPDRGGSDAAFIAASEVYEDAIKRHFSHEPGNAAFKKLREQAEANAYFSKWRRRPYWAPPMIVADELLQLYRNLDYLGPDDPPIARLWAVFAPPEKLVFARKDPDLRCEGFQLHAGRSRQKISQILFEVRRGKTGHWQFGPKLHTGSSELDQDRHQWRARAIELARARVLDFAGAPDVQMRLAGRLCGLSVNNM